MRNYYKTHTMGKLLESDFWVGYLAAIGGWLLSFILPIVPFLVFVMVLVFTDLYTGTKAAKKRGEKINSKGFRRTVEKISLYFIGILIAEGMRVVFSIPFQVAYVVSFAIAISEFKSNIENIETVTGVHIWESIKKRFGKLNL